MKLSFARQILPIIAVAGIIIAAIIVFRTQPDRSLEAPEGTPPRAPTNLAAAVVAGSGVIEPESELIEIGTFVPGVIDHVYVRAGDQVAKGQPLFDIDSRDARAAVAEAQATVQRLRRAIGVGETALATARRQLALYQSVGDDRAVSQQEVIDRRGAADNAAAELAVTRAQLAEAEAQLTAAKVTLARHSVAAPIAGEVLQVTARPGQYATAGPAPGNASDPLVTMGDTDPLHVRIDIDENDIERVDLGKAAVISARGNAARRYRVRYVRAEPLVVPKRSLTNASNERVDVRVLQLIYALDSDPEGLFVGQQVDAYVPARPNAAEQRAAKRAGKDRP